MRLIFILLMMCSALASFADSKSDQILRELSSKLNGYGSYAVNFDFNLNGVTAGRGEYLVSNEKFYIRVLDNVIFSDGKVRYEVDEENSEITIDKIDPNDKNMLSNPAKAFELVGANFTSAYGGVVDRAGKRCELITLVPQSKDTGFKNVRVWVNTADNLPVAVEYVVDGMPSPVVITLTRIERKANDKAMFEFNKTKFKGYEIIDFR